MAQIKRRCPDCGTTDRDAFSHGARRVSRCRECAQRRQREWRESESRACNPGSKVHAHETEARRCRKYEEITTHRPMTEQEKVAIHDRLIASPRF